MQTATSSSYSEQEGGDDDFSVKYTSLRDSPSLSQNHSSPPPATDNSMKDSCTVKGFSNGSKSSGLSPEMNSPAAGPNVSKPRRTYGSIMHAIIICWLVIAMSFGLNILNFLVYLTVRPWSRRTARRLIGNWFQSMWVSVMSYLMPPSELVLSGDVFPKTKDSTRPAIIIANHQVDADFWYCWEVARAHQLQGQLKIILKAELSQVPVVGWGMRQFEFCFLRRNWEQDRRGLTRLLSSFMEDGLNCALLLFPEGTTINTESLAKSHRFAQQQSRPRLKHLLLPRSTGFAACLETMCQSSTAPPPLIYDLTVAYGGYSGEVPSWAMGYGRDRDVGVPSVAEMVQGLIQPRVFVHVKTYQADHRLREDPQKWLDARWGEKDVRLGEFIKHQAFTTTEATEILRPTGSRLTLVFLLFLPLILTCLLPALILLTLVVWPLVLTAGTVHFLALLSRSALKAAVRSGGKATQGPGFGLGFPPPAAASPQQPFQGGRSFGDGEGGQGARGKRVGVQGGRSREPAPREAPRPKAQSERPPPPAAAAVSSPSRALTAPPRRSPRRLPERSRDY